ncbi:MAG: dihydroneopterin aldolase [Alloprevotella sp.]|nr:dihydroneopterin aldolase [Alloprevotella sp.]
MKIEHTTIRLENLRFHAYHGVIEQERTIGGEFSLDIEILLQPQDSALQDDNLDGTANYASICNAVAEEMNQPSNLLEHVAHRILKRLLADFPVISQAKVYIRKLAPPMEFDCTAAGVEMTATR